MRVPVLVGAILWSFVGESSGAVPNLCKPIVAGKEFDFESLKNVRKEVLLVEDDNSEAALLYLSLCEPLSSLSSIDSTCQGRSPGLTNVISINIGGCKEWGRLPGAGWKPLEGDTSIGLSAEFNHFPGSGQCVAKRSALVNLKCGEVSSIHADLQLACQLVINITDPVGCPVGDAPEEVLGENNPAGAGGDLTIGAPVLGKEAIEGLGPVSVLLILFLVVVSVYCIAGIIQNVRTEGRSGLDAIPHREFWFALPSLLVHLVVEIFEKVAGLVGAAFNSSSSSYQSFGSTMNADAGSSHGAPNVSMPATASTSLTGSSDSSVL
mmetsp:Transcript_6609/g.12203  ORF Transcript_6609/g.12203 Transcript_6609/m.12203 type:complete len:322 (+) Transcript_6609:284-1249(+)